MSLPPSLQQASNLAKAAVENDQLGNFKEALDLYERAAHFLELALADPALGAQREQIRTSLNSYRVRAESLRSEMNGTAPVLPNVPADTAPAYTPATTASSPATQGVAVRSANPSVLQVGWGAVQTVNREGGKYLLQGYQAARAFDQRNNVSGKVIAGAATVAAGAVKLNNEYRVTERIGEAASSAYTRAKAANEEHKILEKTGTIAKAAVTKVGEVDREYQISQKVGSALLSGLNYLSSASSSYLAKQPATPAASAGAGPSQ
ncbi:uncharacterized protein MONBRDRAFT_37696 [Monosiga brevicollis MX1]|uniref:MIT domain-containing protein n=1 Tax=Monosiga brevicollis TaxID=81824 RepID=A9V3C1_MONBE|nr:uncharacterized protein MONBRDRAFT_37696 [Monosiga brevicollis MX1]EDQ88035.1 predicted protein [Monosiga brevicollis MX1]|eukprot:XP_001747111.1 hypothetical protein [Monosiga brevicollis MX1]